MISIVIPVYNGEDYLAECIKSVLDQTYTDTEIIIVDDGSTDNTQSIAMKYKKEHPDKITVYLKGNGGTGSALNLGIEKMKGDWFKWLSADDRFTDRHALQDMMVLVSTIPNHHDYIFYTDYNIIDSTGKRTDTFHEPERRDVRSLRNAELFHNFYGNGSTSLIHKKIINEVGVFRERIPYGEDLEYWLRCCLKYGHTLYHLPLVTVDYRVHKQSLTWTKKTDEDVKNTEKIKKEYAQYLDDEQLSYIAQLKKSIPLRRKIIPISIRSKLVRLYKKGL